MSVFQSYERIGERNEPFAVESRELQRCGLLRVAPQSMGKFVFVHALFQEYFACRGCAFFKDKGKMQLEKAISFANRNAENVSLMEFMLFHLRPFYEPDLYAHVLTEAVNAVVAIDGLTSKLTTTTATRDFVRASVR